MDTVQECDGRTDGQTDGRTDRITITKAVQRIASRGKNQTARPVCLVNVVTDTRIYVYLGSKYYDGKVEGLCGNYNGRSSDDFGAESSTIAASLSDQASAWKIVPSCPEPEMQSSLDACEVCFSESPISNESFSDIMYFAPLA